MTESSRIIIGMIDRQIANDRAAAPLRDALLLECKKRDLVGVAGGQLRLSAEHPALPHIYHINDVLAEPETGLKYLDFCVVIDSSLSADGWQLR